MISLSIPQLKITFNDLPNTLRVRNSLYYFILLDLFTCDVVAEDSGGDDVSAGREQLLKVGLGQVFRQP
jgi:hypothetical protein